MLNLIWNKEEDVLAERQGLEVWGYRMCMKDRMRRFLVDVLDIHNKDVIEKVIGISSIRHYPKGWACTYQFWVYIKPLYIENNLPPIPIYKNFMDKCL